MSGRSGAQLTATVMVTSFRRPRRLTACLEGIRGQSRPAEEVVVVVHVADKETAAAVERLQSGWDELRSAKVAVDGSVAALNCGLAAATGDVVAIVDDDAIPRTEWLQRIMATYALDDRIAAVGGRDVVIQGGETVVAPPRRFPGQGANPRIVGRVRWFGRMLANHHIGVGGARDVDVLKGANMSVRRGVVLDHGYDERLHGVGAVVHTELSICLPLRRQGYRIVYDPAIEVTHYPESRPHGDHRFALETVAAAAHNEALQLLDHFGPAQRAVFALWSLLVGTTEAPGGAVLVRDLIRGRPTATTRFIAAQRGRAAAWRTRRGPRAIPRALTQAGSLSEL